MGLIIIAAIARNNVIGNAGTLPWNYPEDLKHFRDLTLDHPVIMGRRTYESIIQRIGKPLPRRHNILLTHRPISESGVVVVSSLDEAIRTAETLNPEYYVIGGNSLYEAALPIAEQLEITHIERDYEGDTQFPEVDWSKWRLNQSIRATPELLFATYTKTN